MNRTDEDTVRVRHMLEAATSIRRHLKGRSRQDLESDELLRLGLERLLEMLGEAARHVSPGFRAEHPEIPWRSIIGTRDHLVHGYDAIDLGIIWSIVKKEMPRLVTDLRGVTQERGPGLT
ncbi:MAG: HepT-like ribonuclease domain-containing protein [Actinomycetota bacterium]